jgi:hypothetical protein
MIQVAGEGGEREQLPTLNSGGCWVTVEGFCCTRLVTVAAGRETAGSIPWQGAWRRSIIPVIGA